LKRGARCDCDGGETREEKKKGSRRELDVIAMEERGGRRKRKVPGLKRGARCDCDGGETREEKRRK
jgi:hypothetical protein